jgi:hypothetical protein
MIDYFLLKHLIDVGKHELMKREVNPMNNTTLTLILAFNLIRILLLQ